MEANGQILAAWLRRREPEFIDGHRVWLDNSGCIQDAPDEKVTVCPWDGHEPAYGGQAAVVKGEAGFNYSKVYSQVALRFEERGYDERSLRRRCAMLKLAQVAKEDDVAGAAMIHVFQTMSTTVARQELYGNGGSGQVPLLVDVMEWATPLQEAIKERHWGDDRPTQAVRWVLPVFRAFDRLHTKHGVVHRDIDAGNLLVDARGNIKVADWGIVAVLDNGGYRSTQAWGKQNSAWVAPEHRAADEKGNVRVRPGNDVWSLGCLLCFAVTGSEPIYRPGGIALPKAVLEKLPETLEPLLNRMLDENHESRITLADAIAFLEDWLTEKEQRKHNKQASSFFGKHYRRVLVTATVFALMCALGVLLIPANLNVGSSDRPTYTIEDAASEVTFNSITNNPNISGDERNFVGARENDGDHGMQNVWNANEINVQPGKSYIVRMYVHNNARANLAMVADNVTARFNMPSNTSRVHEIQGSLAASNASPQVVHDHVTMTSAASFNLRYEPGSLLYENDKGTHQFAYDNNVFGPNGVKLGYERMDGKIPGCFQYAGYLSFVVTPQFPSL